MEMLKYKITSYGTSQTFPLDLNEMKWQIIMIMCVYFKIACTFFFQV